MDDCPKEFLEFNDTEDEIREQYENKTSERVRLPDGTLALPWDERFKTGHPFDPPEVPANYERVTLPFRELYPSLEAFARDWHGHSERDPEKKRFGYWENPNKKWDWYQIGGRWNGFFPVKSNVPPRLGEPGLGTREPKTNTSDVCRVGDLDLDRIATLTREKAEAFWERFVEYRKTGTGDPFDGPRSRALDLGLVTVLRDREPTEEERPHAFKWSTDDERRDWYDVVSGIDQDTFLQKYIDCFSPISAYAALDVEGWHAPGQMGWFGMSSDTPDSLLAFKHEFHKRFINGAAPDDTLVIVDCHI